VTFRPDEEGISLKSDIGTEAAGNPDDFPSCVGYAEKYDAVHGRNRGREMMFFIIEDDFRSEYKRGDPPSRIKAAKGGKNCEGGQHEF